MPEPHALALRTSLAIGGADDEPYTAALRSAADTITVDLASPEVHGHRGPARRAAARHAPLLAAAGRAVQARVSDTRSGELEADLAAVVGEHLDAVQLSGAETAQNVRDADVAIRRHEMRLGIVPGSVRLIPLLDSAAGLLALPAMLNAVDRHSAVVLDADGLCRDLDLSAPGGAETVATVLEHAMWDVAVAARAADLLWLIAALTVAPAERATLAARAREFGASGACVRSEAEVLGLNALFTPEPESVAAARRIVQEWDRLRGRGHVSGVVAVAATSGEGPAALALVDRRSVRRARALIARAGAIERR